MVAYTCRLSGLSTFRTALTTDPIQRLSPGSGLGFHERGLIITERLKEPDSSMIYPRTLNLKGMN